MINRHDNHGYLVSLFYFLILSNFFLPNLTRDLTLDHSHLQLGLEISIFLSDFCTLASQIWPIFRRSRHLLKELIFFPRPPFGRPREREKCFSGEGAPKKDQFFPFGNSRTQFFSFELPNLSHFSTQIVVITMLSKTISICSNLI